MPWVIIESIDILDYAGTKSTPVKEGETVFKAVHMIMCQVEDTIKQQIFALGLQTSALNSSPYEIIICIRDKPNK